MSTSMPVKLSGPLVSEARQSAKRYHRSLTGQIEHWAALGKAIETRLPGDALEKLLAGKDALTIDRATDVSERQRVADILVQFVTLPPEDSDTAWLKDLARAGVPIYGTRAGSGDEVLEMDLSGGVRSAGADGSNR